MIIIIDNYHYFIDYFNNNLSIIISHHNPYHKHCYNNHYNKATYVIIIKQIILGVN